MQQKLQNFRRRYGSLAMKMVHGAGASQGPTDDFYRKFEDRFRGQPADIASRLESRYRKTITTVSKLTHRAADLGCGRGEFLDVTRSLGFSTFGTDISSGFVSQCLAKGHQVENLDALAYLRKQPSQSFDILGSFHVVEHCGFNYNYSVIQEAHRVLATSGVLIIETPALFSLWAGHRQFFLDPTHEKPIHPELMAFMCENAGFARVELVAFDEVDHPDRARMAKYAGSELKSEFEKLEKWLYGPMDQGIIAFK